MQLGLGQPKVSDTTNILEIKSPKEMETPINTGHPHMNRLFSETGVIAGSVVLVTGDPGAGKSTLMASFGDCLTGKNHLAIYVTGEESVYQVRRTVKRLGLKHGFIPSYQVEAEAIIEHCERLRVVEAKKPAKKRRKIFLIIDSLQCLRVRPTGKKGRPPSEEKQQMAALSMLTEYAKNNWMPTFFIGHVTKNGTFAGKNTVKHIIDCHLHLSVEVDDEGFERRILEMSKNRFGPTGLFYEADMTAKGLVFESDTAKSRKADDK